LGSRSTGAKDKLTLVMGEKTLNVKMKIRMESGDQAGEAEGGSAEG